jgi:hypothetical protein
MGYCTTCGIVRHVLGGLAQCWEVVGHFSRGSPRSWHGGDLAMDDELSSGGGLHHVPQARGGARMT